MLSRNWLASFLASYENTLIVVSHDMDFLQHAVSSIAEVKAGRLELYKSRSYNEWLLEREERMRMLLSASEANKKEIGRMQKFVDR